MDESAIISSLRAEIAARDAKIEALEAQLECKQALVLKNNPSSRPMGENARFQQLLRLKERIKAEYLQMLRQIAIELHERFSIELQLDSGGGFVLGDYVIRSDPTLSKKIRDGKINLKRATGN